MGETGNTGSRAAAAAVTLALALCVTGCAPPSTTPTTRPTATAADSEAALLAEAIDVYTRYSAALDVILASGDGDYSSLEDLTTPEYLHGLSEDGLFDKNKWVTRGSTSFDSEEILYEDDSGLTVQLCRDVSKVRIVDAAGVDVTPPDRDDRFLVEVTFVSGGDEQLLRVGGSDRNPEKDVTCER